MSTPKCPLCGATSSNVQLRAGGTKKYVRFPDKCHFCKAEENRWEQDWIRGPDMVDRYGGRTVHEDPFRR